MEVSEMTEKELRVCLDEGMSQINIAEKFNVSRAYVRRMVERLARQSTMGPANGTSASCSSCSKHKRETEHFRELYNQQFENTEMLESYLFQCKKVIFEYIRMTGETPSDIMNDWSVPLN